MVSEKFISTVRLSNQRAYRIAIQAGLHPSTLSKLINRIEEPRPDDERVLAVGRVLGLKPGECFDNGEVEA